MCAAICDGDDPGLQGDCAELMERTAVPAKWTLGLQRCLDVGFLGFREGFERHVDPQQ